MYLRQTTHIIHAKEREHIRYYNKSNLIHIPLNHIARYHIVISFCISSTLKKDHMNRMPTIHPLNTPL